MMPDSIVVQVGLEWEERAPEEVHHCFVCTEAIYYREHEAMATLGHARVGLGVFLCTACRETLITSP